MVLPDSVKVLTLLMNLLSLVTTKFKRMHTLEVITMPKLLMLKHFKMLMMVVTMQVQAMVTKSTVGQLPHCKMLRMVMLVKMQMQNNQHHSELLTLRHCKKLKFKLMLVLQHSVTVPTLTVH